MCERSSAAAPCSRLSVRKRQTSVAEATQTRRPQRGLTFSLPCDRGFAVAVVTHDVPRIGSLIWIAEPIFEEQPALADLDRIERWRWCVFFPVGAALRRKLVTPIGVMGVPQGLEEVPAMRSGSVTQGWTRVEFDDGVSRPAGRAADPSLPIYQVVNDTRLREMIDSEWRPEDEW